MNEIHPVIKAVADHFGYTIERSDYAENHSVVKDPRQFINGAFYWYGENNNLADFLDEVRRQFVADGENNHSW